MENAQKSEVVPSKDAFAPQSYIYAKIGEETKPFKVKHIKKTTSKDSRMCLAGVDYRIEVWSSEDKIITVTSWPLYTEFQRVIKELGPIENKTIKVNHPEKGKYEVIVLEGDGAKTPEAAATAPV